MRKTNPKQHSAEHILDNVFGKLFQSKIIETKFKEKKVRCDFDVKLEISLEKAIKEVEKETNKIIDQKLPVNIEERAREELKNEMLHKIPKDVKNVRLVKIGDNIVTPCCGEHVSNTSEIGVLRIKTFNQIEPNIIRLTFVLENK